MPKCTVCEKENEGLLCAHCGFDASADYESFPTLGFVTGQAVSARKKVWENAQNQYCVCASCGSKQFLLDGATGKPVCAQCGASFSQKKRCPVCGNIPEEHYTFCNKCGTRVDGKGQQNPMPPKPVNNLQNMQVNQNWHQNQPKPSVNNGGWVQNPQNPPVNQNWSQNQPKPPANNGSWGQNPPVNNGGWAQNPPKAKDPSPGWYQKHIMISKYLGEPAISFAQSSGTLYVYLDRLEYVKNMGNSAAAAFGLVGIAVAANKMKKSESVVEVYPFREVQNAYMGKYSGLMATLVLQMEDGQKFTFAGTFTKQTATNLVHIILNGKKAGT